jgi:hypothetical protein
MFNRKKTKLEDPVTNVIISGCPGLYDEIERISDGEKHYSLYRSHDCQNGIVLDSNGQEVTFIDVFWLFVKTFFRLTKVTKV